MPARPVIAILNHEIARDAPQNHLIKLIQLDWVEAGFEVKEVFGASRFEPADLAVLHVDLSVVPPEYLELAGRYPRTINGNMRDIRKRSYSANQVAPTDDYQGSVIVKTSLNYAGRPEEHARWMARRKNPFLRLSSRLFPEKKTRYPIPMRTKADYRIYASVKDVPPEVFASEELIVEKFLPERAGDLFCLREWYFLGGSELARCEVSDSPIFTSGEEAPEKAESPPQEIRDIRRRLGIDYGKIDYAICEGRPVLFDVNKTTGFHNPNSPKTREYSKVLSEGIYDYFPEFQPRVAQ